MIPGLPIAAGDYADAVRNARSPTLPVMKASP